MTQSHHLNAHGAIPWRLTHRPGLDGLRGVAVVGVVAHHLGLLTGGYLGVDLFFVLSGFLITTILLSDVDRLGRISLGAFWARRARRLLPALFAILAIVALWAAFGAQVADRPALRREGLAGLLYLSNWQQISVGADYWATFRAMSPLRHLWSLAIEEQFYLVWPLVVAAVADLSLRARRHAPTTRGWAGRRRTVRAAVLSAATFGVVVSEALRWLQFDPDQPTTRLYFGTDTRASAILMGAAAAAVVVGAPSGDGSEPIRRRRTGSIVVAAGALACTGWLAACWIGLAGTDPWLYRGGLTSCGVAATVVVVAASRTRGVVPLALSWSPLRWLGRISYSLYLWHWPVIAVLDERRLGVGGWRLLAVRLTLSLLLAVVSHQYVETPIRRGWTPRLVVSRWGAAPVGAGAVAVALVLGTSLTPVEAQAVSVMAREPGTIGEVPPELVLGRRGLNAGGARDVTTTPAWPRVGAAGGAPRVMIVGDSVADSIAAPLQAANGRSNVVVLDRALVGCPLVTEAGRERTPDGLVVEDRPSCTTWPEVWRDGIAKFVPDAAIVVLGTTNSNERLIDGEWRDPCSDEVRRWLTDQFGGALDLLGRSVPHLAIATTAMPVTPLRQPGDTRTVPCKNAAIRAAAASRPQVTVVELGEWVCPAGECRRASRTGEPLRADGLHFTSPSGGEEAGGWVLSQLGLPSR